LKALMWREVGIERNGANLTGALGAVRAWEGFALRVGPDRIERLVLLNMLLVARLVNEAALMREESRGTHFRRDFPQRSPAHWVARLVHERGREIVRQPLADPQAVASTPASGEVD
jgi:aspartate oxidase